MGWMRACTRGEAHRRRAARQPARPSAARAWPAAPPPGRRLATVRRWRQLSRCGAAAARPRTAAVPPGCRPAAGWHPARRGAAARRRATCGTRRRCRQTRRPGTDTSCGTCARPCRSSPARRRRCRWRRRRRRRAQVARAARPAATTTRASLGTRSPARRCPSPPSSRPRPRSGSRGVIKTRAHPACLLPRRTKGGKTRVTVSRPPCPTPARAQPQAAWRRSRCCQPRRATSTPCPREPQLESRSRWLRCARSTRPARSGPAAGRGPRRRLQIQRLYLRDWRMRLRSAQPQTRSTTAPRPRPPCQSAWRATRRP